MPPEPRADGELYLEFLLTGFLWQLLPRQQAKREETVLEDACFENSSVCIRGYLVTSLESGAPCAIKVCLFCVRVWIRGCGGWIVCGMKH